MVPYLGFPVGSLESRVHRDNGKENRHCHNGLYRGYLGLRVLGFESLQFRVRG